MTIAVKKHAKLDNKLLKSCPTLLDFSTLYQIFCPGLLQNRRYYVINFSCNLTRVRSQGVMWVHGWLPVTIGHHLAKYGGHKPCRRGDKMFPIWHVTSCDHVIKESRNLILGFVSLSVNTLQRLITIRLLEKEIFCF